MRRKSLPGLLLAWGGTLFLISPAQAIFGAPERLTTKVLEQLFLLALLVGILVLIRYRERCDFASIGWRGAGWMSWLWGLAAAGLLLGAVVPLALWLLRWSGLPGFGPGRDQVLAFPASYRLFAVVVGGVFEEVVLRAYVLERLAVLLGSRALGAIASLTGFALLHWPLWGPGPVLTLFVTGGFLTAFYLWRRDLTACCIAHVLVDSVGLVLAGGL